MLVFLLKIHDALDKESSSEIIALYTDFLKAFHKVPHLELLEKLSQIGVGDCILEVISDYLDQRQQFVRVDNTSSQLLDVTGGISQGSCPYVCNNEESYHSYNCSKGIFPINFKPPANWDSTSR